MIRIGVVLTLTMLAILIVGCGQKGPLFLPGDEAVRKQATSDQDDDVKLRL